MKKVLITLIVLAFVAAPVAAAELSSGCDAKLEPADAFALSLAAGDGSELVVEAAGKSGKPSISTRATCIADCGPYADVGCTGKGTCIAVDRDCSVGQGGYASCSTTTTYCPACECIDGQTRSVGTSECCCNYSNPTNPRAQKKVLDQVCSNGVWVTTGFACDGQYCSGPSCPL